MFEQMTPPTDFSAEPFYQRTGPGQYGPLPLVEDPESEPTRTSLKHQFWLLRRHLWKIAAYVAVCLLITFLYSARLKPMFESTATIDVDLQSPSAIVGQGAVTASYVDPDETLATQIHLVQSDAVLRPVAEEFNLATYTDKSASENYQSKRAATEAPVSIGGLTVTRPANTYLLLITYRSPEPHLSANVANAIAKSYVAHIYDIRIRSSANLSSFMEKQLDELKAKMEHSSLALAQFEKDLEVINPDQKTNILSARLLQLNTEYTTAQAERVRNEAAWKAMQSGSVEAAEVSSQGQALTRLAETLNQAHQHFALIKTTYGETHPEYKKAASELAEVQKQFDDARQDISKRIEVAYRESINREEMLLAEVQQTKAEWDSINSRSFQYNQLKQEAAADKALYDELITKIHESNINAGFQGNDIRIADIARPSLSPVSPNVRLNLLLAFVVSTFFAIAVAILFDSLDTTLRDPQAATRFLRADVIGTLPLDRKMPPIPRIPGFKKAGMTSGLNGANGTLNGSHNAASDRSISSYEEAVRTIRNTILLSDFDGRLRSIMVASAQSGEGKTTLAVHLAIASAASGKRTLLVDGDMRRPSIHTRFGLIPREGLSNVLTGDLSWKNVVQPADNHPNLSLLLSGPSSHRVADLIGSHLGELLDEFAKEYDLVVLDSPPFLGFAECLQMARGADGVLVVSRAGATKRKAVASVVSALQRLRANLIGVVLNQVTQTTSSDSYSQYGSYYYKKYE
jgi:succinoglycan biosynthesis transport protein ExoP